MTKSTGKKIGRPATGRDKAYAFRLPADLMGRVTEAADAAGVNHSAIVREALGLGLDAMSRVHQKREVAAERKAERREQREKAAKARKKAEWPATLAERTSGMTEKARAEVYAANAAADAAEAAYEAIAAEADTYFGQLYRGGVHLFTQETHAMRLAHAKARYAVKVVNALLIGKERPKWRFNRNIEEAVAEAEQRKAADFAAYLAEHPGATFEDFKAAVEVREAANAEVEAARQEAEGFERSKRSAKLWDERAAAQAAGLPWSPPEGSDDIGWISKQYPAKEPV